MGFIGQGEISNKPLTSGAKDKWKTEYYSEKYQWLPTDFEISEEGKVKARSYINNLHPIQHKDMYPVLEEIFEKFHPMFEEVLADMRDIKSKKNRLSTNPYGGWYEAPDRNTEGFDYNAYCRDRVPIPVVIPEFEPR
ncbi:hypothetical protein BGX26_009489, partial [Mortierella sp. AD094]